MSRLLSGDKMTMADRLLLTHLSLFTLLPFHRLGHQAEVQLKRELERQRKALINEHKRQQKQAADNLRQVRKIGAQSPIGALGRLLMCISFHFLFYFFPQQDLDAQHQTHVREVKTALSDRKDREFEVRLKRVRR